MLINIEMEYNNPKTLEKHSKKVKFVETDHRK